MTFKEYLEARNITPTELAAISGVALTTIYRMFRKERVRRATLRVVCQALNISEAEYDSFEAEDE